MRRSDKEVKQNEALKKILKGGTPEKDPQVFLNYDQQKGRFDPKADEEREVGDIWIDDNGNKWEQKKGYKIKHSRKSDVLAGKPLFCPECGRIMNRAMDEKMYYRNHMCGDCVIERETKMKAEGTYDLYEKKKILSNMKSWYRDIKQGAEDFFNQINDQQFVTEFGVEEWSEMSEDQIDEMKENTLQEFEKIENSIEKIEKEVEQLKKDSKKDVSLKDYE